VRVACLVPAYNHEAYVADAVASVLAAGGPVEVVAVDDASTDGTYDVLRSLTGITVLRNERNLGAVATVERAIAATTAPYLTVLASDDRWLPGRLAAQLPVLEAGAAWSFGPAHVIDGAGRRTSTTPQGPPPDRDGMLATLLGGQGIYAPALMYRRDFLTRIGGLQHGRWEDLATTLRFAALAEPVFVAEPLVEYRVHGANVHLTYVRRREHATAHAEAIRSLLSWAALPEAARPTVAAHAEVWALLERLVAGERVTPRAVTRAALDGVVRRQAADLVRDVDGDVLRRFEVALRLAGARDAARAIADVRGGPLWRRALRKARRAF
jgi:glycosyltransferase involved in cell wall biosynthesis